ncbi:MAG: low molecular weight protein arginine phosphatase [Clostridia bacterium]|nr:low molecular weight protein arginine phosphatase [Clostridia bacterium]
MKVKKTILFICTGNTCRSPMAEALLKAELKNRGIENKYDVRSAGLYASLGNISNGAKNALERLGISEFSHFAVQLDAAMLFSSDIVLCMTQAHKMSLKNAENVFTLHEFVGESGDVSDPYGGDDLTYYNTASELLRLIKLCADKLENKTEE